MERALANATTQTSSVPYFAPAVTFVAKFPGST
jgi:hypothetical protein